MARPRKYSKATLHAIVPVLIEARIYPGIRAIQERIGGGTTTIARDLREMGAKHMWEIAQESRLPKRKAGPSMTDERLPTGPERTRESAIEESNLRSSIEDLRKVLSKLEDEISELRENRVVPQQTTPDQAVRAEAHEAPFHGMSIAEAAMYILQRTNGPMTTMKIAYTLESEGFKFVKEPSRAVNNALLKRSKRQKDVVKVGYSTWGLNGRDTSGGARSEIDFSDKTDKDYQVARIELAHALARERGTSVGRPAFEKSHPFELIQEFRRLRELGASVSEALKACSISRASYLKYRKAIEDAPSDDEFRRMARLLRLEAHSA